MKLNKVEGKKQYWVDVSNAFLVLQDLLAEVDRFCGLVVRVPGYRSRSPGSITALPDFLRSSGSGTGSLLSTIEKLLERESIGSGPENREYDRRDPLR
jgi:hypothetical protein